MDWPRYLRAVKAGNIEGVEDARRAQMTGSGSGLTGEDAEAILEHDRWVEEDRNG